MKELITAIKACRPDLTRAVLVSTEPRDNKITLPSQQDAFVLE